MLNLNSTTLQEVATKAASDAATHPRWLTAIGRALVELDSNPWIERGDLHGLIIGSPSGKCYAANGVCQCKAFEHKLPCWHRAAARLVRLHDEALERQQVTMPEGDTLDTDGMRVRRIAYEVAKRQMDELFA
jgi:hypothetical protein